MIEDVEQRKKLIKYGLIAVGIIAVLFLANAFLANRSDHTTKEEKTIGKIENDKSYVYSKNSIEIADSGVYTELPYININSTEAKELNSQLEDIYQQMKERTDTQFTYTYSAGEKYVSLALLTNTLPEMTPYPETSIQTYTFSLATGQLVSDSELLTTFKTTKEKIAASFEKEMKNYYQQEIKAGFMYEKECDYQCFLKVRNATDYQQNLHLFVDNDTLKYYRPFIVFTVMGEESFYQEKNEDFLFEIR